MKQPIREQGEQQGRVSRFRPAGIAGWLLARLAPGRVQQPRLAVLERVTLAPRQSLALVEADGRRLLVGSSAEGGPVFYELARPARAAERGRRISW